MARLSIYETRLGWLLAEHGYEATREQLRPAFERERHLNEAVAGLVAQSAVIEDRVAGILRLQRGRARELLGLPRIPAQQQEMFNEGCLLDVPPEAGEGVGGPPAVKGTAPRSGPISRGPVLEISNLVPRDLRAVEDGTRLRGREKGRFEQAMTERAQAVSALFRRDQYLAEKLEPRRRLREELLGGRTPTARKFAVLYASKPDRARELLGACVLADNPAANLNVALRTEGVRY